MRKLTVIVLPAIIAMSSACNERAEMGQGNQRNRNGGGVIPESFNNTLNAEQFRGRALNLKGTALTLNATVEAALAGNDHVETIKDAGFAEACKSLAMITGGITSSDDIRALSKQTALTLNSGTADCNAIPALTGIDSFRTMNALRYLASELAANNHTVTDCLSMQPKNAGRQAALAWTLEPVLGKGTWLEGKDLKQFDGGVEGGGNEKQNAFNAWLNIETRTNIEGGTESDKLTSAVAVFNESAKNTTLLEKVEQYEQKTKTGTDAESRSSQVRITTIELDYAKSEIKETTTYKDLIQGEVVSQWQISAVISGQEDTLILDLNAPGSSPLVHYNLNANNELACSVSN